MTDTPTKHKPGHGRMHFAVKGLNQIIEGCQTIMISAGHRDMVDGTDLHEMAKGILAKIVSPDFSPFARREQQQESDGH